MRRWATDRLRLAARWAWSRWGIRLFVFAHSMTKREQDALFDRVFAQVSAELAGVAVPAEKPKQDKTLH